MRLESQQFFSNVPDDHNTREPHGVWRAKRPHLFQIDKESHHLNLLIEFYF